MRKLLFLLLLVYSITGHCHGSSHIYRMSYHVDMFNNPYMICHDRVITIEPIIQLHVIQISNHIFYKDTEEVTIDSTDSVSSEYFNHLYDLFVNTSEYCSHYNDYNF